MTLLKSPVLFLRWMYDFVMGWAESPYGTVALFILAVSESIFFPIPPDVLLIALCVSIPKKAFRYALICTMGSVIGGMIGFGIGKFAFATVGVPIIHFYHAENLYLEIQEEFRQYGAWIVAIAGFTPIPYKIFTISSGAFDINFRVFFIASLLSRGARFYLVSLLIYRFGGSIKRQIEKHFNWLSLLFIILLIGGFIAIKKLL